MKGNCFVFSQIGLEVRPGKCIKEGFGLGYALVLRIRPATNLA